ncbi:AAA family ATPase [Pedobacter sp. SD-b]|uniref:AAA family ATPase n=1 Tax=Pedobacter segetis TaxID=2793069 RepID=A0ABS1BHW0_9SPHI|nr:AAA family ATPase [Pedobacter segetis]MBK0382475.1 AAA family ATPase [Pedobacter segetis]
MSIAHDLAKSFPHLPNPQQLYLFEKLDQFMRLKQDNCVFVLKGYAGTGKTTVISTLIKLLPRYNLKTVLLAPTGRAAKVLGNYSKKEASTIHRKIYRKKTAVSPDMHFSLSPNLHKDTLFIIDEASMIADEKTDYSGSSLLEDVISYVYENQNNNRIVFIGDTAQLPPVGSLESPALAKDKLQKFRLEVSEVELTQVVRQEQESGILRNATTIRELIRTEEESFPTLVTRGYKDVYRMMGDKIVEGLNYAYDKYGMENSLVVCRSNKGANIFNQSIRNQILWREDEITGGDLVMVVKNNYFWLGEEKGGFIANGDIGKITRVKNIQDMYGFRFAEVQILFADIDEEPLTCSVMLDTLYSETSNLPYNRQKELFEEVMKDYEHLPTKRAKMEELKKNPYFNALQIKFAYAVTCHKAQGGQWEAVFIDQGYLTEEMINIELLRWLYTATTRASKELFYVNFTDLFFPA